MSWLTHENGRRRPGAARSACTLYARATQKSPRNPIFEYGSVVLYECSVQVKVGLDGISILEQVTVSLSDRIVSDARIDGYLLVYLQHAQIRRERLLTRRRLWREHGSNAGRSA